MKSPVEDIFVVFVPSLNLSSSARLTFLQLVTTPMAFIFPETNLFMKICTPQEFSAIRYSTLSSLSGVLKTISSVNNLHSTFSLALWCMHFSLFLCVHVMLTCVIPRDHAVSPDDEQRDRGAVWDAAVQQVGLQLQSNHCQTSPGVLQGTIHVYTHTYDWIW